MNRSHVLNNIEGVREGRHVISDSLWKFLFINFKTNPAIRKICIKLGAADENGLLKKNEIEVQTGWNILASIRNTKIVQELHKLNYVNEVEYIYLNK